MLSKHWYQSFGFQLYQWVILLIIVPVVGVFVYSILTFETIMKDEISQRSIDNISSIEYEISNVFDNLVTASNALSYSKSVLHVLLDNKRSYYERTVNIDNEINNLMQYSNPILESAKITIFDNEQNVFSNWPLNFNDYQFLYEKEWVQQAIQSKGHLVWRLLEPSYIKEENDKKYISLARVISDSGNDGKKAGLLIISLDQEIFIDIFRKSKYVSSEDDSVIITNENKKIMISLDPKGLGNTESMKELHDKINQYEGGYIKQEVDGKQYLVNYYTISRIPWTIEDSEWKVLVFSSYDKIMFNLKKLTSEIKVYFILIVVVVLVVAGILTLQVVKPIRQLSRRMKKFKPSEELIRLDIGRKDEIGYLNLAFYNMAHNIQELFAKIESEYRIREQYRFESLRAQLNPHFLFNSLNTIRWMALLRKADNIVENIDALVKLLDYSMSRGSEYVTLHEEIEHIHSYVLIQNSRYGGKYELVIEADPNILLSHRIIRFILQPAVENAIIHGYKEAEREGIILVKVLLEGDNLAIYIIDNGIGIAKERLALILSQEQEKRENKIQITGIGLKIINERIKMSFGKHYGINIKSESGKGTKVKFLLPLIQEEGNQDAENNARR